MPKHRQPLLKTYVRNSDTHIKMAHGASEIGPPKCWLTLNIFNFSSTFQPIDQTGTELLSRPCPTYYSQAAVSSNKSARSLLLFNGQEIEERERKMKAESNCTRDLSRTHR